MKILIAEDNVAFRLHLEETLTRWGYEVLPAEDGWSAWQILQAPDAPRLVILDWGLPGLDGIQICRRLRQRPATPYTYMLLVTGRSDKEDIVNGLEAGADDYLVKPIDVLELNARLRAGRRILDLQAQLLEAQEALRHQATHDPLTGLGNRAAVLDTLDRELARGFRESRPVGLLVIDVDHFKRVNDTHGHPAGDGVLREVGRRLSEVLRPYDTLGRYGGEEFLVILPDCDPGSMRRLAERLRHAIRDTAVDLPDGLIPVTISLGGACSDPATPGDASALLRTADQALYRAKRLGRDRTEITPHPAEHSAPRAV